jgi:quinohemoprotein ethanol dehydrogenase
MRTYERLSLLLVSVMTMAACDRGASGTRAHSAGSIDAARLRAADAEPGQWMAMGRTYKGERFSPLTQVNDTNATRLGFAWEYEARSHRGRVEHGQESSPIVVDGVLYASGPWGAVIFPSQAGGHNWNPMAYSPVTGLAYIPARHQGMIMSTVPGYQWTKGQGNTGARGMLGPDPERLPPQLAAVVKDAMRKDPTMPSPATQEWLMAWDPVTQTEKWRVPTGNETASAGGVLVTAGNLVVQGTYSGHLVVYRADNGARLHDLEVGTAIMAAPIAYELDGEQYIAVMAGLGGAGNSVVNNRSAASHTYQNYGRILAFKLGGGAVPLPPKRVAGTTPEPPPLPFYTDALADRGAPLFGRTCGVCHAGRGEGRLSSYPDLHRLTPAVHAAFESIVLGGALKANGMASFADVLTPDDVRAIHAYLWREQRRLLEEERSPVPAAKRAAAPTGRPLH